MKCTFCRYLKIGHLLSRSFCTALFSSSLLQETWEKVVRIKICNRSLERSIKLDQLLIGVSQVLDTKSGVTNLFDFPRH